jgi:hypothetical protein
MYEHLDTKQQLEQVVDDVALLLAHEADDALVPLIGSMRAHLQSILERHLSIDAGMLSDRMVENIIEGRHQIRLAAGQQISRTLH